ncbi:MAG: EVE domain-containing protein [Alphaproteobacteria bacterium]|nr:EVE domain-containing protein [Alphaproteobacteria bacterium]
MAFWHLKSEPETWSWEQQLRAKTENWDGVRNAQAMNNMKAMCVGDRAFFYHSGEQRAVVGIVEISKPWFPDPKDATGKYGQVEVRTVAGLPRPVTLRAIKANPQLAQMWLVRHSRLSVAPITEEHWHAICRMGGYDG